MSLRSSTKILDYLGDLGGFYATIDLFLFMFGQYFSAKFFFQSIVNQLYIRRKTPAELMQTYEQKKRLKKSSKKRKSSPSPKKFESQSN